MVTLIVVVATAWVAGAVLTGLGVGRVISRADYHYEMSEISREHRAAAPAR